MKEIILEMQPALYNYVDIDVLDRDSHGEKRKRCTVRCEFGKYDVEQLKKRGMNLNDAVEYYKKWLYDVVKVNLASEWTPVEGYEEVMAIITENTARFY